MLTLLYAAKLWQNRLMQFWDIKTIIFFPHKWLDLILKIFFCGLSSGRVCGRWHRDALHGGGTRVLHQGYEQWEEKEWHCALFTAGWRENTSFNTIVPNQTVGTVLKVQRDSMNEVFVMYKYHCLCFMLKDPGFWFGFDHKFRKYIYNFVYVNMANKHWNIQHLEYFFLIFKCSNGWFLLSCWFVLCNFILKGPKIKRIPLSKSWIKKKKSEQ